MNEKDPARILAEMIREELRKIDPDFDSGFHVNLQRLPNGGYTWLVYGDNAEGPEYFKYEPALERGLDAFAKRIPNR
jgi:hypothetical protein